MQALNKSIHAPTGKRFSQVVDGAQSVIKLTGPTGGDVAHSRFALLPESKKWQWVAFDEFGAVREVIEMPFVLDTVCNSRNGALWALRRIAAKSVRPDVRSTKD